MDIHYLSLIVVLIMNLLTLVIYGIDKLKACKGQWRIAESTLLLLALLGGSIGAWAGMHIWHHKTLHKKFKYGIPLIVMVQIAIVTYLHTQA